MFHCELLPGVEEWKHNPAVHPVLRDCVPVVAVFISNLSRTGSGRLWAQIFVYSQNISSQNLVLEFGERLLSLGFSLAPSSLTEEVDLLAEIVL